MRSLYQKLYEGVESFEALKTELLWTPTESGGSMGTGMAAEPLTA